MGFTNPRPPDPPKTSPSPPLCSSPQSPMPPNLPTSICVAVFCKTQVEKMKIHLLQPPNQQRRHSRRLRSTHHRRRDWFSIQVSILSPLLNSLILIKYNIATSLLNYKESRSKFQLLSVMINNCWGSAVCNMSISVYASDSWNSPHPSRHL